MMATNLQSIRRMNHRARIRVRGPGMWSLGNNMCLFLIPAGFHGVPDHKPTLSTLLGALFSPVPQQSDESVCGQVTQHHPTLLLASLSSKLQPSHTFALLFPNGLARGRSGPAEETHGIRKWGSVTPSYILQPFPFHLRGLCWEQGRYDSPMPQQRSCSGVNPALPASSGPRTFAQPQTQKQGQWQRDTVSLITFYIHLSHCF